MTRVFHLIQQLSVGGASRSAIALAKYSAKCGDFTHSIGSILKAEPAALKLADDSEVTSFSECDVSSIMRLMETSDIVHGHFWNSPEIYDVFRHDLPLMRLLLSIHIAGDELPQVLTSELIDFSDHLLLTSPYSRGLAVLNALPEDERTRKTAMVYDTGDFERLRDVQPKAHSGFNVGYIGMVDFVKMHPNFVPMCASIEVPQIHFTVCGPGKAHAVLRTQARELRVSEKFEFRGYEENIGSILEILDVFGYPLCQDNYSTAELALQEAMFCGIPPVVFNHGGAQMTVTHGQTGFVVKSEAEYKQAIEYLFHNPHERARLSGNCIEYARKAFGAENVSHTLNSIYNRLTALPKRHRRFPLPHFRKLTKLTQSSNDKGKAPSEPSGAELFIQSLGEMGRQFEVSLTSEDINELFEAEQKIAISSPVLFNPGGGGIFHYRSFYPKDENLRLWSGLVLANGGRNALAAAEFKAAIQIGVNHWRVFWYLAQAAERAGARALALENAEKVTIMAPEFSEATLMVRRIKDQIIEFPVT
jgi:glycosyltransferase involved in cell wall biosynthesis